MKKTLLSLALVMVLLITGVASVSARTMSTKEANHNVIINATCRHTYVQVDSVYLDSWEEQKLVGDTVYFRMCTSYACEYECTQCGDTITRIKVVKGPWGF